VRIGIGISKRKGSEKNVIGIRITGIARSSFIVGSKITNYRLSEVFLSAMVIIGMIGQIDYFRTMIDEPIRGRMSVHDRLGAGLACMISLVNVLVIFQGIKKSLKKWQMYGFQMNLYFVGMLILIGWSQGRFSISQCKRQSFPNGAQKG